jgi:steroid 5-alpha reductase family enzyme
MLLFLVGFLINVDSDRRLRNLRRKSIVSSGCYCIPSGGLFEYVSAANYFGEIVEWCGFAIAAANVAGLFFATSTAVFLGARAIQHHK